MSTFVVSYIGAVVVALAARTNDRCGVGVERGLWTQYGDSDGCFSISFGSWGDVERSGSSGDPAGFQWSMSIMSSDVTL